MFFLDLLLLLLCLNVCNRFATIEILRVKGNQSSVFGFDTSIYCSQALFISISERLTFTIVELKKIWKMVIESSRTFSKSLGLFEYELTSLI